ncbi:MAG: CBS domain-containing protein, partial [Verrucomicrobiae bacterium]|nr:CBS domain-containing protein [Verrucomicrobiae bacterium]
WVSEKLTKLLSRKDGVEGQVSRDEVVALAQLGLNEGVIEENENKIIRNLIRLRKIQVEDIMTPRTVVSKLPESMTCGEVLHGDSVTRFSRIPVHGEHAEEITGYVLKRKILEMVAFDKHDTKLSDIKRPIGLVSEHATLSSLFNTLISSKDHIALVVDDYGGVAGLVTNEDLIETLLGLEIMDESDDIADMRELARKKWQERAKRLGIQIPDIQDHSQDQTPESHS